MKIEQIHGDSICLDKELQKQKGEDYEKGWYFPTF